MHFAATLAAADLAPALLAVESLDACPDFATFCDERRDAWIEALDSDAVECCEETEAA